MSKTNTLSFAVAALILGPAGSTCLAGSIQAYAFSAAGESSCSTYAPTAIWNAMQLSNAVSTPGAGCSVIESESQQIAASGTVGAAAGAAASFVTLFGAATTTGASLGKGTNTLSTLDLGVASSSFYSGATDSNSVRGAEAFAFWVRSFTAPATTAFVRIFYDLDGVQTIQGRGDAETGIAFRKNADPQYLGIRLQNGISTGPAALYNGSYVGSGGGITILPASITVLGSFFYDVAAAPGETFDLRMVLYSWALGSSSTGLGFPSDYVNLFDTTASVSSIVAYSGLGPIAGGTLFQSAPSAIPEPATGLLALAGCAALAWRRRAATLKVDAVSKRRSH